MKYVFWLSTGDPITTAGQRNQMLKMLAIILIPVSILVGLTGNSFGTTLNNYLYSTSIRSTLLFSLDMAYMIRSLQRERDGSALYLSSIRPETKGFLLERYESDLMTGLDGRQSEVNLFSHLVSQMSFSS